MPIKYALKMVFYEEEKRAEQRQWELYLTKFPNMTKKTFKPYEPKTKPKISKTSEDEIFQTAMEAMKRAKKG